MQTVIEAHYENGRWGAQRASVTLWNDGRYTFCDGHGDPWACKSYADAKRRMRDYMADKRVVARPFDA